MPDDTDHSAHAQSAANAPPYIAATPGAVNFSIIVNVIVKFTFFLHIVSC